MIFIFYNLFSNPGCYFLRRFVAFGLSPRDLKRERKVLSVVASLSFGEGEVRTVGPRDRRARGGI